MANGQPEIIVLGGPNGCGKTTSSQRLLADTLKVATFVNADVIARGLAGHARATASAGATTGEFRLRDDAGGAIVCESAPSVETRRTCRQALVHSGGHHILDSYARSMSNFFALYGPIADLWRWYDNTVPGQTLLVAEGANGAEQIHDVAVWQAILTQVSP